MCRCLTKEIWDEYKDQKDGEGVSFKVMVFSGVKNLDSGIGLYAGSHDSYKTFNKLFDKVVMDYHKHGPEDNHVSNMDATALENTEFTEEQAAMVISTRIRVGRNLDGYPLGPGISKDQRLEVMEKVSKVFETIEDEELKGSFYKLEGMDEATQKKLIEDHFLFK